MVQLGERACRGQKDLKVKKETEACLDYLEKKVTEEKQGDQEQKENPEIKASRGKVYIKSGKL